MNVQDNKTVDETDIRDLIDRRVTALHAKGSPLFSHTLFGLYLGLMVWGELWLRDNRLRALMPLRR